MNAAPDRLRLRLDVPERVRAGEPVAVVIRVENVGDSPLELYLRGRTIAFDVIVSSAAGLPVWRRLYGEIVPAILRLETMAPGATLELVHGWDQRTNEGDAVAPGVYGVRGELLTDAEPLVTPASVLVIVPG